MSARNFYELLGLSPSATGDEIRDAFRDTMYRVHPDHNPGEETAVDRTMEAVEAFHVLTDPVRRARYDIEVLFPLRRDRKPESRGFALFSRREDKEKTRQAEELLRNGVRLYEQPDGRKQAASEFVKLTRLLPDCFEGHFNLAVVLAVLGRTAEALDALGRAQRISPDAADLRRLVGRLGQMAQAGEAGRSS